MYVCVCVCVCVCMYVCVYVSIHLIHGKKEKPMRSSEAQINEKHPQTAQDQDLTKHSHGLRPTIPQE